MVLKSLVIVSVFVVSFTNVLANDNAAYSFVAQKLTDKLKSDLAQTNVKVELTKVQKSKISKNKFGIEGDAICSCDAENDQMPLRFKANVDSVKKVVTDIEYDFVENVPAFAPTSNEEVLMQELMKQISQDFNTRNIVIAIDSYEDVSKLTYKNEFTGIGEVRIGDFVWKKIKFDVVLNPENRQNSKVVYDLGK